MAKYFIVVFLLLTLFLRFITLDKANLQDGQDLSFSSRLTNEPQTKNGRQTFQLFYKGNRVNISTTQDKKYYYGETLSINGRVSIRLINNKDQYFSINFPRIEAKNDKLALLFNVRQLIIHTFEKTLPSDYASLLMGIVFGIKGNFSSEFLNGLKLLGLMHIIAASGMNVALTAGFLSSLFLIFLKRQVALVLTILGIAIYAFLAGFEPSIVRASIMGIIAFTAQILGRQRLASYSLLVTGYIMILFSPFVVWDIGFQLSFLSTAGLIFIRPILYQIKILEKFFKFIVVGEDVTTTIAAQIVSLPILIANFGLYSIFSVIINALVLWTIPLLMVIGGLGFMISVIFEPVGRAVMYLSIPLLFYFKLIVELFSNFPGTITLKISWPFIAAYYLFVLSFVSLSLKKNE